MPCALCAGPYLHPDNKRGTASSSHGTHDRKLNAQGDGPLGEGGI